MALMEYTQKEGICSVAFQSFNKNDLCHVRPEIDELMEWLGQSSYIETSFEGKKEDTLKLVKLFNGNRIEMLIMKGLSLAPQYPMPAIREFGDLDIYTFDKHQQANDLIRQQGIGIEMEDKHDKFTFGSVLVEHHNTFLDIDSKTGKLLNDYLLSTFSVERCEKAAEGWFIPAPNLMLFIFFAT